MSVIATTADDNDQGLARPQRRRSATAKLARYQHQITRCKPDKVKPASTGYKEAKHQAAEDFRPRFLAKSTMAKKAADAAIGATKAALVHMADKHGRDLRLVIPAYTTMDCSICGARAKHHLDLSERTYDCDACGVVLSRGKNAAAVMVARAGFVPAGAEGARPGLELPVLAT